MRSRRRVVIARLNEEEYRVYQRLLVEACKRHKGHLDNDSERFRAVLVVMREFLREKAYESFWMHLEVG
jgi:hypothetical protein